MKLSSDENAAHSDDEDDTATCCTGTATIKASNVKNTKMVRNESTATPLSCIELTIFCHASSVNRDSLKLNRRFSRRWSLNS